MINTFPVALVTVLTCTWKFVFWRTAVFQELFSMKKKQQQYAIVFYFPHDVCSNNVYTKNCLVQKRKLHANSMQIHPKRTAVILNAYFV